MSLTDFVLVLVQSQSQPSDLVLWGTIVAAVAGLVTIWRFSWVRPEMVVEAEMSVATTPSENSLVRVVPSIFISNLGRRHAEDVYLKIRTPDWEFDREGDDNLPSTVLDFRTDGFGYVGASGYLEHIFIDDTIYHGSRFDIFPGSVAMEPGHEYVIEYTIACRAHGPREGSIVFEANRNSATLKHKYPTYRRRMTEWIKTALWDFLLGEKIAVQSKSVCPVDRDGDRDNVISASAVVENAGWSWAKTVTATFEFLDPDSGDYRSHRQVKMVGLEPGELWVPEIYLKSDEELKLDVVVEARLLEQSITDRGPNIRDCEFSPPESIEEGQVTHASVCGTVENTSVGTRGCAWVVAKFYTTDGRVTNYSDQRFYLDAGESEQFELRIGPITDPEHSIADYSVVLI